MQCHLPGHGIQQGVGREPVSARLGLFGVARFTAANGAVKACRVGRGQGF